MENVTKTNAMQKMNAIQEMLSNKVSYNDKTITFYDMEELYVLGDVKYNESNHDFSVDNIIVGKAQSWDDAEYLSLSNVKNIEQYELYLESDIISEEEWKALDDDKRREFINLHRGDIGATIFDDEDDYINALVAEDVVVIALYVKVLEDMVATIYRALLEELVNEVKASGASYVLDSNIGGAVVFNKNGNKIYRINTDELTITSGTFDGDASCEYIMFEEYDGYDITSMEGENVVGTGLIYNSMGELV